MLRDTLAMKAELSDDRPVTNLTSVTRLREMHASVSAEFRKLEKLCGTHRSLPLPPLPGVKDGIIPLRSQTEFMAEGREQKNCVAGYVARVLAGNHYVYRVIHPSRATLSISRQSDGNWGIGELEAFCNRPMDSATRDFVNGWLESYKVGL